MRSLISDVLIDAVEIAWDPTLSYQGTKALHVLDELRLVRDFFSWRHWSTLINVADCASSQSDCGINNSGFRFGDELDPGEEPFEGVELYDPLGQVYIGRATFNRLMLRFFDAIIQGATEHQHPMLQESWWSAFLSHVQTLRGIVERGGMEADGS